MDRGVWRATAQGVAKSQARLHDWAHTRAHTVLFTVALCIDRTLEQNSLWYGGGTAKRPMWLEQSE